jgi:hypothetical protein
LSLHDRYHEILALRREGIRKYGGRMYSDLYAPPCRLAFPAPSLRAPAMKSVRLGPLHVADAPPVLHALRRVLRRPGAPLDVLEIGPGEGTIARALQAEFPQRIATYAGIELDASVRGPYRRIDSVDEAPPGISLLIASEVIEHMSAREFFEALLPRAVAKMNPGGVAVIGTPNALAPTAIFNDFSHVQGYAWYDLYALLRLCFEQVEIYRARYVWSFERLASLLPRIVLCRLIELDWCEGLIAVAERPRAQ